jgi:hypothetical protein
VIAGQLLPAVDPDLVFAWKEADKEATRSIYRRVPAARRPPSLHTCVPCASRDSASVSLSLLSALALSPPLVLAAGKLVFYPSACFLAVAWHAALLIFGRAWRAGGFFFLGGVGGQLPEALQLLRPGGAREKRGGGGLQRGSERGGLEPREGRRERGTGRPAWSE